MKIRVLGSGCTNCHKLYEETLKAIENTGRNDKVEYVTDIQVLLQYGIMKPPAIVVEEKIVSQGRVLKAKEIEKLLKSVNFENEN